MCFSSVFNGLLKLPLQLLFYWHLPFEEQCRDSNSPWPKCKYFSEFLWGIFPICLWGIFSWSLWLLGSPGTLSLLRNWALFSDLVLKQSGFPHPKLSPMGLSQITWKMWASKPQNGEIWDQSSCRAGCPLTSSFNPEKKSKTSHYKMKNKLSCVPARRGGSRRCCCHHLVCHHQPGDIMPRADSWGQWQGLTALPATAGVTRKCVCVPPALPGDLNSTGH